MKVQKLSQKQERKLLDFIDDKFLDITRNFKKRNHPSTTLPTLVSYLNATHPLLSIILQIPPVAPQATLRTALLLRLTGEFLGSVPGYPPDADSLPVLLEWLDALDRGWAAVLRSQAWDPESRDGVYPEDPGSPDSDAPANGTALEDDISLSAIHGPGAAPVNQTDRTRLRSIVVAGTSRLEEWLEGLHVEGADDLGAALERLGLQQSFDDLFVRTLSEMCEFTEDLGQVEMSAC